MGRIDCCHKCDRPIKSPYCHNTGVCPDYTRQREKLNAENAKKLQAALRDTALCQQRADGVARALRGGRHGK